MEKIPCQNQDMCRLAETSRGCFEDVHHLYYPRRDYRSPIEKQFRELDDNKVRVCRDVHDNEHAMWVIPDKPDFAVMKLAVAEQKNKRRTSW